jgi:uncharacterized lipoprotein YmbA
MKLLIIILTLALAGCATTARRRVSGLGLGAGYDPATGGVTGTVNLQFFRK